VTWSYIMPDGRTVETFPFGHGWRWRIQQTPQYAEITGVSKSPSGARVCAVLAWRDSAGVRAVPSDARQAALSGAA